MMSESEAIELAECFTDPENTEKALMKDVLRRKWLDLLGAWSVGPSLADRTFEEVCQRYAEPGRFYHTLHHIRQMLETVEQLDSHASNRHVVRLAVWLHDVIYDSRASDNEEHSSDYAEHLCEQLSIPEAQHVAWLIRKTKTHEAGDDPDAQVLLDADLAILGAAEPTYWDYAERIRQEYAWVPEGDYRKGRRLILESFLRRSRIYHFLNRLEAPARRNLAAEIARLAIA